MIAGLSDEERAILEACRPLIMQDWIAELTTLLAPHFERVLRGDASRPFIGMSFDLYCRALLSAVSEQPEAIESVERLCDRSEARFGQQPWTDLNRACLRHMVGDWPASVHLYRRARREAEILWPGSQGCTSVIDLDEAERWVKNELIRPVRQLDFIRSAKPFGVIGLVACDFKYLRLFWPIYVASAFGFHEIDDTLTPCAPRLFARGKETAVLLLHPRPRIPGPIGLPQNPSREARACTCLRSRRCGYRRLRCLLQRCWEAGCRAGRRSAPPRGLPG